MKNKDETLTVLVTRPDPEGPRLCQAILAQHDHAIHLPTIEIAPPDDLESLQTALSEMSSQDWLIFISPQSVYAGVPYLRRAWPILPERVRMAAIGKGTHDALLKAGYAEVLYPHDDWNSEGLLALPEFQSIKNKKIAIFRGPPGRELLEKTLSERGAMVLPIICYQRILPKIDISNELELLKQNVIDVIMCTSFESVRHLKELIADSHWPYLLSIPLIVNSERIKVAAQNLGFKTVFAAENASDAAFLKILAEKRNELCRKKQTKS